MKYLYNPVTNDLDKIADIEAAADKKAEAERLKQMRQGSIDPAKKAG